MSTTTNPVNVAGTWKIQDKTKKARQKYPQLFNIVKNNKYKYNIKLYEERRIDHEKGDDILDGDTLLFKHYWKHKVIPNNTN